MLCAVLPASPQQRIQHDLKPNHTYPVECVLLVRPKMDTDTAHVCCLRSIYSWQGSPFVYLTVGSGESLEIRVNRWHCVNSPELRDSCVEVDTVSTPGTVWLTVHGISPQFGRAPWTSFYGLFGGAGATWTVSQDNAELQTVLTANLGQQQHASVAVLPDDLPATRQSFLASSRVHVEGSQVTWTYDKQAAQIRTTYQLLTRQVEDSRTGEDEQYVLSCVLPHQLMYLDEESRSKLVAQDGGGAYTSPRGQMLLIQGTQFTTVMPVVGVLPHMPYKVDDPVEQARLARFIEEELERLQRHDNYWEHVAADTYWLGKELERLATLVPIARGAGNADAANFIRNLIRSKLEEFFTSDDVNGWYYDRTWKTLIGYPTSFFSDTQISDHEFHWGYFVYAAATVAFGDPTWSEQWGPMVQLLIEDVACTDRNHQYFPFLRQFDVFEGHSWASGHANFHAGNNLESSSESMNFHTALIYWAYATNDDDMLSLGTYLYTTNTASIQKYWFNVDDDTWEPRFAARYAQAGMIWSNGATHTTWWTANEEEIFGINYLPIQPGSLYLGLRQEMVLRSYSNFIERNGEEAQVWAGIIWGFLAMGDTNAAVEIMERNLATYQVESGESRAFTFNFI